MTFKKDKRGNLIVPVAGDYEYRSCRWITARGIKRYNVNHHVRPHTGRCAYCQADILESAPRPASRRRTVTTA